MALFNLMITFYSFVFGVCLLFGIVNGIYWLFGGHSNSRLRYDDKCWKKWKAYQLKNKQIKNIYWF